MDLTPRYALDLLTASVSLVFKAPSTEDEKVLRIEVDGKLLTGKGDQYRYLSLWKVNRPPIWYNC